MKIFIQVKVFPASNGECILIKFIGKRVTNILIDCGYVSTYKIIKEELHKLKENNEKLDLVVLTHIDNDHINGARCIFADYINDRICEISEVWYNDYFSIYDIENNNNSIEECEEEFKILQTIIKQKYPNDPNQNEENFVGYKTANILVDYLQNEKIYKKLNKSFTNGVFIENKHEIKSKRINDEVELIILGPKKEILQQLVYEWRSYLKKKGFNKEIVKSKEIAKAFELFYVNKVEKMNIQTVKEKQCSVATKLEELLEFNECDTGLENRSSISFILKFYDKSMLFLGDSSPIDYDEVLEKIGQDMKDEKLKFDLVKVSHHGSKYNISKKFFDIVTSDRYIISTNGYGHHHPDFESIYKIICMQKENKLIKFNYKQKRLMNFVEKNKLDETNNFKIEYENESLKGKKIMEIDITDEVIESKGERNE
ncbi:MBL fold metallo-hydrolase [Clostridium cellulovorans]|uniref:Zn-dependent hydrolase n=1 Tax=Clostridium cellulovorans (strain ATCC 35296 / DSM 3052 / OCM 3 / 743B) TaxID=573061 RepID=D9SQ00_CLOC7|nr:MBL fold metallo-hydrolase [Clostridium cellulovorans]ADL52136.1 Zn-dependent hydrolase [Clostridium cellulovorans 743B]